jgi:hypothetical protein
MEVEGVVWAVGVSITTIISSVISIGRKYWVGSHQIAQRAGWFHGSASPPFNYLVQS